jgi:hypothetical protein
LSALLTKHPGHQLNHRGETGVFSEGSVGVVLDLFEFTVGTLDLTTNAVPVPSPTVGRVSWPTHRHLALLFDEFEGRRQF